MEKQVIYHTGELYFTAMDSSINKEEILANFQVSITADSLNFPNLHNKFFFLIENLIFNSQQITAMDIAGAIGLLESTGWDLEVTTVQNISNFLKNDSANFFYEIIIGSNSFDS